MAKRTDSNQTRIVKALRKAGASVEHLTMVGNGCPGLLAGVHGLNLTRVSQRKIETARQNLERAMEINRLRWANRKRAFFTCRHCGAVMFCKPREVSLKTYCSKRCEAQDYQIRLRGEANPHYRDASRRTCAHCGEQYRSYVKDRKYCSHRCYLEREEAAFRMTRQACRIDNNQTVIVEGLRVAGVSVLVASRVSSGFPDAILGYRGKNYLIEIKNPHSSYGRKGLNKRQNRWAKEWGGAPVSVVYTLEEALGVCGLVKPGQR